MGSNSDQAKAKMTRWGVGPVYGACSVLFVAILSALNITLVPALIIPLDVFAFFAGVGVIGVAIVILVVAVIQVQRAFASRKLVTAGIYAYMRDPIYPVWILFVVPGLVLVSGLLLLTFAPFLMFVLLKKQIGKEEAYLELTFAKEYSYYKSRVNSVIPKLTKR